MKNLSYMKNPFIKNVHLLFSSLFILSLHIPFVFAKSNYVLTESKLGNTVASVTAFTANEALASTVAIYDSLHLDNFGLSEEAFQYAVKGYDYLKRNGRINNEKVISIVDFTKPSTEKRLFVIDMERCKVLFNTYVAHGQGSGKEFANRFSNVPESFQSSLGFYVTTGTYNGKHGYSLHLEGLEKGINDKADERAIVIHGAPYVSESYIRSQGCLGRSWGCPAVPEKLCTPIIEKIKDGSCLFIYGKNKQYLRNSRILNS